MAAFSPWTTAISQAARRTLDRAGYALTDLVNDRGSRLRLEFQASIVDALRAGKCAGVIDPPDFLRDQLAFGAPLSLQSTPPERVNRFTPRMQSYVPLAR